MNELKGNSEERKEVREGGEGGREGEKEKGREGGRDDGERKRGRERWFHWPENQCSNGHFRFTCLY